MIYWTESQVKNLREWYGKKQTNQIAINVGHSDCAVRQKAKELGINKVNYLKWTTDEENLLIQHYAYKSKIELRQLLSGRTWERIKHHANSMRLRRCQKNKELIQGKCEKLLKDTPEAFYWTGFFLADGHFSKEGRFTIRLSIKDKNHLRRLSEFLESHFSEKPTYIQLAIMDKYNVEAIKEKFNIHNRKTYFPPNFDLYKRFTSDNLFSMIIGYIDGDGSIRKQYKRKDCFIAIKLHASWLLFLQFMNEFLSNHFSIYLGGVPKLNKKKYAVLNLSNIKLLGDMKKKAIRLNLPIMERKWGLIDEDLKSHYYKSLEVKNKVINLRKAGYKYKEIEKIVCVTKGRISTIVKNHIDKNLPVEIGRA